MSQPTDSQRTAASVLVIAADTKVESLVGHLVEAAGHRPLPDPTVGAAGESVRRVRPDVTLVDASLPPDVVRACLAAADEVISRPVLIAANTAQMDVGEEAPPEGLFFSLPGAPDLLARVLDIAVADLQQKRAALVPTDIAFA